MLLEDTLQTVTLTPSHYFDDPQTCFKRGRGEWKQADAQAKVLHPDVYWWLREHVGFEMNEVWDVDRYFYPDEALPDLPNGAYGAWIRAGRVSFYGHRRSSYSHNQSAGGSIYFDKPRHATAFRKRFAKWHDSWKLITKAMNRRFPPSGKRAAALVRDLPPVLSVASVVAMNQTVAPNAFTQQVYHPDGPQQHRVFHLFCDENTEMDRVMFLLGNSAPDPWWLTVEAAASPKRARR